MSPKDAAVLIGAVGIAGMVAFIAGRCTAPDPDPVLIPGPPASVDTARVLVADTAGMEALRAEMEALRRQLPKPGSFTSDTSQLVTRARESEMAPVESLPGRWYLGSLVVGRKPGELSMAEGTWLESDSLGINRRDGVYSLYTPGPLEGFRADEDGLHFDFGEWERPKRPSFLDRYWNCGFACDAGKIGIGIIAGVKLSS